MLWRKFDEVIYHFQIQIVLSNRVNEFSQRHTTSQHAELVLLLKDLRLKADLSQAEVAETLGRPQTYVSAIEVGQRGVDLLQVRELCQLYRVDFPEFAKLFDARLKSRESERRPPRRRRRS
jgi:cyanate lyase